jgi:hypothetical protein
VRGVYVLEEIVVFAVDYPSNQVQILTDRIGSQMTNTQPRYNVELESLDHNDAKMMAVTDALMSGGERTIVVAYVSKHLLTISLHTQVPALVRCFSKAAFLDGIEVKFLMTNPVCNSQFYDYKEFLRNATTSMAATQRVIEENRSNQNTGSTVLKIDDSFYLDPTTECKIHYHVFINLDDGLDFLTSMSSLIVVGTLSSVALIMSLRFIIGLDKKNRRAGALAGMDNMNSANEGGGASAAALTNTISNTTTTTHTNLQGPVAQAPQPAVRLGGSPGIGIGIGISDVNVQVNGAVNNARISSFNSDNRVEIENASLGLDSNNNAIIDHNDVLLSGGNGVLSGNNSRRGLDSGRNRGGILGNIVIGNERESSGDVSGNGSDGHMRNISEIVPLSGTIGGQPRSPQSDDDGQGRGMRKKKKNLHILVEDN